MLVYRWIFAKLTVHQGSVSDVVLGDSEMTIKSPDLSPIVNLWWDLKKATAAKLKNISKLEAVVHKE